MAFARGYRVTRGEWSWETCATIDPGAMCDPGGHVPGPGDGHEPIVEAPGMQVITRWR
jgi:hypothetical protein